LDSVAKSGQHTMQPLLRDTGCHLHVHNSVCNRETCTDPCWP
jgi:hypothetical protein